MVEGSGTPKEFIPKLVNLYLTGKFPFDKLVKFYEFNEMNQAAIDSEKGITLNPIIRIGL